ncbi:uncharacterized protein LOC116930747 [Daphnia magna]|uniref:uncharacterized protein LOC116930747 n=1 Tax=Daphnia magna TaxID=35525 RepID=UPI001E1BBCB9|nr:uncharacterized protein LOC116930747 [Daphnia magna]
MFCCVLDATKSSHETRQNGDDKGNICVLRTAHQLLLFNNQTQMPLDAKHLTIYLELGYTASFIAKLTGVHVKKDEPGRVTREPDDWDRSVHTIPAVDVPAFSCPLTAEQLFELERRIRKENIDLDNLHIEYQEVKNYVLSSID